MRLCTVIIMYFDAERADQIKVSCTHVESAFQKDEFYCLMHPCTQFALDACDWWLMTGVRSQFTAHLSWLGDSGEAPRQL